jgi:hypothetical protein
LIKADIDKYKYLESKENLKIKKFGINISENDSPADRKATELFTIVLARLSPGVNYFLNETFNKMISFDKSFKISETKYKNMRNLAKEFEDNGLIKTEKNEHGQSMFNICAQ